jgi:hypothetical protein
MVVPKLACVYYIAAVQIKFNELFEESSRCMHTVRGETGWPNVSTEQILGSEVTRATEARRVPNE